MTTRYRTHAVSARPRRRSSQVSALARGLVAGGSLLMADDEAFALAADIEGHPDNVAPAFYGGFTIAYRDEGGFRAASVAVDPRVQVVAFVPPDPVETSVARGLLPASVPHADAARECGPGGAAGSGPVPRPRAAARRHRGPAAPGLPGAGNAGDPRPGPQAARRRAPGRGLRRRPDGARLHRPNCSARPLSPTRRRGGRRWSPASTRTVSGSPEPARATEYRVAARR